MSFWTHFASKYVEKAPCASSLLNWALNAQFDMASEAESDGGDCQQLDHHHKVSTPRSNQPCQQEKGAKCQARVHM